MKAPVQRGTRGIAELEKELEWLRQPTVEHKAFGGSICVPSFSGPVPELGGQPRESLGLHTQPKNAAPVWPSGQVAVEDGVSVSPTEGRVEPQKFWHRFYVHLPLCRSLHSPEPLPAHRCASALVP